jgi:release factor glutamine methyltransferase
LGVALSDLIAAFRAAGIETPALDARRLAVGCLGIDAIDLLREPERPITSNDRSRLSEAVRRRLAREPVSRILGERAFYGLDLEIDPSTLDPRPDTETLVDGVVALVEQGRVPGGAAPRILDIGTGSGAILVALLNRLPEAAGLGIDISDRALAVAARNAARHGVSDRARFQRSTWLDGVEGEFDIVVSNPPYIPSREISDLDPDVAAFDPIAALDGGADGLDAYRALAAECPRVIVPAGWISVEVGAGQSDDVARLLSATIGRPGGSSQVWADLSGIARCVAIQARPEPIRSG